MTSILGSPLEHRLLGALLRDPRHVRDVLGRVRGDEFITPALGDVFDGLCHAASRGEHLSEYTIAEHFPDWGIRGVEATDPNAWVDAVGWAGDAVQYADAIRHAAIRTKATGYVTAAASDLRDLGVEPSAAIGRLVGHLNDLMLGVTSDQAQTKTLAQILEGEDTYDWVIPGMLERRDRLIVTGNEGGGKTTFLRQLAVCAAAGVHPFIKTRIEPQRVLVVDTENSERQWRRTSRWIANRVLGLSPARNPATAVNIATIRRMDITRPADLSNIHRYVDQHTPDLLMIGPLYRLYPRAITNDDDAAPVLAALDTLRDRDITLVMEAHAGKATDENGDRNMAPRGSSALLGWPEFGFGLRQLKTDPGMSALVRWRGDRDERAWPAHLYRGGDLPWTPSAV